jgi:perosamine synthetase
MVEKSNMIKLASPDITAEDIQRAVDVIKSGNLVQGQNVLEFEKKLCVYSGISNSVVVSSGTAALHLSLMALGISPGDSVIVPAFTFPATANVAEALGAEVILTDVDAASYVMTPEHLEDVIKKYKDKNLKAVIVVHEFGYPARIKEISEIAKRHRLYLIEDSACALGTIADKHHTGFYSDAACFSFHPRKAITTGEGGAVLTVNPELAEKISKLRNHGMHRIEDKMEFKYAGLNYRMTDFQAALAIGQLERFNDELIKRKKLADIYFDLLKGQDKIYLPEGNDGHSWQSFMVVLDQSINRGKVIKELLKKGIQSNLGAQALNCLSYYINKYFHDIQPLLNTKRLYSYGLVLPIYGKLNGDDIALISEAVTQILKNIN